MSYKCQFFEIHELVPPSVFEARGEKAWELLDDRLLRAVDALRERFGPATINNYKWGGDRQWSGLRMSESPWFSPYSQHTFGRAADLIFKDVEADKVRKWLERWHDYEVRDCLTNAELLGITGIEKGISWVHIDVRNFDGLKLFTP